MPQGHYSKNIRTLNFSSIAPQGQYSKKIKIKFFSSSALENDVIQGALLEKGATRRAVLEGHYSRFNAPILLNNLLSLYLSLVSFSWETEMVQSLSQQGLGTMSVLEIVYFSKYDRDRNK